jgi:hypothetical protein
MVGGRSVVVTTTCKGIAESCAHLLDHVPKWWLPDAIAFARTAAGRNGKLQKDMLAATSLMGHRTTKC